MSAGRVRAARALLSTSDRSGLAEFAAAPDTPDIPADALERIEDLYENNFYLGEAAGQVNLRSSR